MKYEEKMIVSKDQFAGFLLDSAKQVLTEKNIVLGELMIRLPDTFEIKLEYKEKKEKNKFEIEVVWPSQENAAALKPMPAQVIAPKALAGGFKETKKAMEKTFLAISDMLNSNRHPSPADLNHFLELVRAARQRSKQAWQPAMTELEDAANALVKAANGGDYGLAETKIAEIKNLKDKYHRIFK